jgi:hypothetical protein
MTERRVFDMFKKVPVVGHLYGLARGNVYEALGDHDEAAHSREVDLADLNPHHVYRHLTNELLSWNSSLDKNIWIGKRTLGNQPFGVTFVPGSDIYHWCIQIDGVIYELLFQNGRIYIDITSKWEHSKKYESLCKRFSWTSIREQSSCATEISLRDYAKSFESYQYQAAFPSGNKINCQDFVGMMLAKAINKTPLEANFIILHFMSTMIF